MLSCSVVIAARDAARFLPAALDSVLAQTAPPDEIIVVDDASSDGTAELLAQSYASSVRVIQGEGRGAATARNQGLRAARGEAVAFLDADDVCRPERLARQLAALEDDADAALVFCALAYIDEAGEPLGREVRCPEYDRAGFFGQLLERNRIGSTSAAMARKAALLEVGGFDEALAFNEEYDLWLRLATRGPLAYLDEVLVEYRLHPGNISRARDEQRRNEALALRKHSREAVRAALAATHSSGDDVELAFARVLCRMERWDEAEGVLGAVREQCGERGLFWFLLGNVHARAERWTLAESAFAECLNCEPRDVAALNNLGVVRARLGDGERAAQLFTEASVQKADYADVRHNLTALERGGPLEELRLTLAPLRDALKPEL